MHATTWASGSAVARGRETPQQGDLMATLAGDQARSYPHPPGHDEGRLSQPTLDRHPSLPGFVLYRDSSSCRCLIVALNTPPVSNSVRSAEFARDSMGFTDLSICLFSLLTRGMFPRQEPQTRTKCSILWSGSNLGGLAALPG
jgi:hypothetical protein